MERRQATRHDRFDAMPIDGRWRPGAAGKRGLDRDPFTDGVIAEIPLANAGDVDDAYRGAERAQKRWGATLPQERRDVMERAAALVDSRKGHIVEWLIHESGSTRLKAEWEWMLMQLSMREAASMPFHSEGRVLPSAVAGKENQVHRQPVGVVGVISPWNFPMYLSNRSVAPALALGNAVVIKPASDTPVTGGLLLAEIFDEAGLPPAVLSVIVGAGRDIGDAFIDHPAPRVLSFTGSTPVGRRIGEHAGRSVKRVCLELGGNGPFIVLDDADLDRAVDAALFGKFMHQGQICMAINRILVDTRRYDEFVERFAARASALKYGDPSDPKTVVGPLINQKQLQKIEDLVSATVERGARPVVRATATGLVLPPVVLADVTNDMPAAREELFGPVAPILRFDGDDEAVRIANDTEYGLSSGIYCGDIERGVRMAKRIETGMTHVNDSPVNDDPNTAFGGEKASGIGRFGGEWAMREFSTDHWISVQHEPRSYPF